MGGMVAQSFGNAPEYGIIQDQERKSREANTL